MKVAPAPNADCPLWLQFLFEATGGDAEMARFLQQWAGYTLTGDTREHALVFVFGSGGNGKSVFLNVLTGILADYAATGTGGVQPLVVDATIDRVGADFVEVAAHSAGETRRRAEVREVELLPLAAIAVVRRSV